MRATRARTKAGPFPRSILSWTLTRSGAKRIVLRMELASFPIYVARRET